MRRIATFLGCTEGQAYTLAIAILLTILVIWLGVPPTLRERTPTVVPTSSPLSPIATPVR